MLYITFQKNLMMSSWGLRPGDKFQVMISRIESYIEISLPKAAQTTVFCTNNKTNILLNGQRMWSSEIYIVLSFINDKEKRFFYVSIKYL